MANILISGCNGAALRTTENRPPSESPNETPLLETIEPRKVENRTLVKPEGWPIPDLGKFTKRSQSRKRVAGRMIDNFEYLPTSDVVVYDARRDWAPSEATEHWLVGKLLKFERNGKALAYYFTGYKVSLNDDGTVEDRLATAVGIVISDTNSDGTFESLDFVSPSPEAALSKIPNG